MIAEGRSRLEWERKVPEEKIQEQFLIILSLFYSFIPSFILLFLAS